MLIRRGLPLLSVGLVLLGLELATGALSRSLGRVGAVLGSLMAGEPTSVYLPAFAAGLFLVGLGGVGLLVSAWSRVSRGRLVTGKECRECGAHTRRIKRKRVHRLLGRLLGETIHRRRCPECDWTGLCRIR